MSAPHKDDGKFVVVQGTERVGGLHDTQLEALAEATKRKKLVEAGGQPQESKKIAVKQNLLG